MSIRKHYDEALAELNQALTEMGQAVTDAVENAMEALATTDAEAAAQIIKDEPTNFPAVLTSFIKLYRLLLLRKCLRASLRSTKGKVILEG